ncbi:MAG: LysR family transcriptional regulator, partial [Planctomycetota bacterium]
MPSTDPLSIRQLEVFVALVEQGSFTRAAQCLQLSQSTVSGHVADLERRLGVRLVD